MRCWFSLVPISQSQARALAAVGLEPWEGPPEALPVDAVVVYAPPDSAIKADSPNPAEPHAVDGLVHRYDALQALGQSRPLIAAWRLEALSSKDLGLWLNGQPLTGPPAEPPQPDPLAALLTRALLEAWPRVLEGYLDLELMAELAGGQPDVRYLQRLRAAVAEPESLLQAWHRPSRQHQARVAELEQQLGQRDGELEQARRELGEAREEAELTLLQLHQVQEELEAVFLADREKQQQLDATASEHEQLKQAHGALAPRVAELEQQLGQRDGELEQARRELGEAREEAELTLLQLHQVQEELEHHFLENREFARVAAEVSAVSAKLWLQQQASVGVQA